MKTFYIYRHTRLDTNEVFYVGIGTKKNGKQPSTIYPRAYAKSKRSKWWKDIVNKSKYTIEIVLESENKEFVEQKEIELIAFYGRKCLGQGSLVNISAGGESGHGVPVSGKELKRRSIFFRNYWKNHVSPRSKTIYLYDKNGKLIDQEESTRKLAKRLDKGFTRPSALARNNKVIKRKEILVSYELLSEKEARMKYEQGLQIIQAGRQKGADKRKYKNIHQYDKKKQLIKIWASIKEIYTFYKCSRAAIAISLNTGKLGFKQFYWETLGSAA